MKRRRRAIAPALLLALLAHLLALAALGWEIPAIRRPPAPGAEPSLELSMVRLGPEKPAPPAAANAAPKLSGATAASSFAQGPTPPAAPTPTAPTASQAIAAGPPDCEVEDLPLLTEAERGRCRDQIAAEKGRRLARDSDARIAKAVAEAKAAPRIDNIPEDKRAAYDAVVQARDNPPQGPPSTMHGSGGGVHVDCKHVTFPLLSGVETNPNLFAKKHKQERPAHGAMTCSAGLG